jgi:hypothetical protein
MGFEFIRNNGDVTVAKRWTKSLVGTKSRQGRDGGFIYSLAYVREYPHKIWPYIVQYLNF